MENNRVVLPMKETKEILEFIIALGKGIENSKLDGNITFSEDAGKFWPALETVLPALVDADKAIMEFGMAGEQEFLDLKAFVEERVELHNKRTESFIEDGVSTILNLFLFVKKYFFQKDEAELELAQESEENKDNEEVEVDIKEVQFEDKPAKEADTDTQTD